MLRAAIATFAFALVLGGCDTKSSKTDSRETATARSAVADPAVGVVKEAEPSAVPNVSASAGQPVFAEGNSERGKALIATFECNRCHEVEGHPPAEQAKHCVHCHDDISKGKFPAPASAMARWKKTVDPYTVAPSLLKVGQRLDRHWLHQFLSSPTDLRPHLDASMPRLALSEQDVSDLVAYLSAGAPQDADVVPAGNAQNGRKLMDQKSCTTCHAFSGVPPFSVSPDTQVGDEQQKRALRLAPDLRFARERFRESAMLAWLRDPKSLKADTLMPSHNLNARDAADVAAYLYNAELTPVVPKAIPARLPVLERRVGFDEVMSKVFGVTCRHCHSDPDAALGDGGPGNSGGFGFTPKGLDLATYRGIAAGYLDANKERQSVFLPLKDGTPRLLAVLLARQMEETGQRHDSVRGMPLGLPAVTPEQVQLVESWIAQGRPR